VNVLVISGMWPPDVGGPASHAPEVCAYLQGKGHRVEAATMASRSPAEEGYPIHWSSRQLPLIVRHIAATRLIRKLAKRADVVYTTGIIGRTGIGAALAGTPTVVKLTSDPVFERSLRWGLFGHDLAAFQEARGLRIGILRRTRDCVLARAERIVVPSEALRKLVLAWGVPAEKLTLIRNPVTMPAGLGSREELRRRHGFYGPTLVFAGRLVPQKSIDVALEAIRRNPDVTLLIAGEGPYRDRLVHEARELGVEGRATFLGPRPRRTVFELLRAADAALLPSSWENFPHMAVEALAVGTPVIATDAGGVTEILGDGWNGLLVPIRDPAALAAAIRRYLDDPALQERLRGATVDSVAQFEPERIYAQLEQVLVRAGRER
jgi:glycosyltransferase involved in cell wall biosynthesis